MIVRKVLGQGLGGVLGGLAWLRGWSGFWRRMERKSSKMKRWIGSDGPVVDLLLQLLAVELLLFLLENAFWSLQLEATEDGNEYAVRDKLLAELIEMSIFWWAAMTCNS